MRIITHDTLSPTRKVIAQHHFAVRGCSRKFVVLTNFFMARTKKTPRKGDARKGKGKEKMEKTPSKWGTAAAVVVHRPPVPPARDAAGNPSYKGMNVFKLNKLNSN